MRQRLHDAVQILGLVQIVQPDKARQIPPPKQVPGQLLLAVELGHLRNFSQAGLVPNLVVVGKAPIRAVRQVEEHKVAHDDRVRVCRLTPVSALASEEL